MASRNKFNTINKTSSQGPHREEEVQEGSLEQLDAIKQEVGEEALRQTITIPTKKKARTEEESNREKSVDDSLATQEEISTTEQEPTVSVGVTSQLAHSQGAPKEEEVQESSLEQRTAIKQEVGKDVQAFTVPKNFHNHNEYEFDACIPEDLRAAFEALPKGNKVYKIKLLLSNEANDKYPGLYPVFHYASWQRVNSLAKQNDVYVQEYDRCFKEKKPQQLPTLGDFLNFVRDGVYERKVWLVLGRQNYTLRRSMNRVLVMWAPYMMTVEEIEAQFGKGALNGFDVTKLNRQHRFTPADLLEPIAKVKKPTKEKARTEGESNQVEPVDVSVTKQEEISTTVTLQLALSQGAPKEDEVLNKSLEQLAVIKQEIGEMETNTFTSMTENEIEAQNDQGAFNSYDAAQFDPKWRSTPADVLEPTVKVKKPTMKKACTEEESNREKSVDNSLVTQEGNSTTEQQPTVPERVPLLTRCLRNMDINKLVRIIRISRIGLPSQTLPKPTMNNTRTEEESNQEEPVDDSVATKEEISTEQEPTVPERVPWQLAQYQRYMESKRLERINRISSDLPDLPVDDSLATQEEISTEQEPTVSVGVTSQLAHSQDAQKEKEVQDRSLEQLAAIKQEVGQDVQTFKVPKNYYNESQYQFDACIPEDLRAAFAALPKAPKVYQIKLPLSSKANDKYPGMYPVFHYASWHRVCTLAKQNHVYMEEFDRCFHAGEPQQLPTLGDFLNFVRDGVYERKVWLVVGRENYTFRGSMNKVLIVWAPYLETLDKIEAQYGKGVLDSFEIAQFDPEWRFTPEQLLDPTANVKKLTNARTEEESNQEEPVDDSVATQEEIPTTEQEPTVPAIVTPELAQSKWDRKREAKFTEMATNLLKAHNRVINEEPPVCPLVHYFAMIQQLAIDLKMPSDEYRKVLADPRVRDKIEFLGRIYISHTYLHAVLVGGVFRPQENLCMVCNCAKKLDLTEENDVRICVMCNISVHGRCIPAGAYCMIRVPKSGWWLCNRCKHSPNTPVECSECIKKEGGPWIRMPVKGWIHIVCFYARELEAAKILAKLRHPKRNYSKRCCYCQVGNYTVQCYIKGCSLRVHPSCAANKGNNLGFRTVRINEQDYLQVRAICNQHATISKTARAQLAVQLTPKGSKTQLTVADIRDALYKKIVLSVANFPIYVSPQFFTELNHYVPIKRNIVFVSYFVRFCRATISGFTKLIVDTRRSHLLGMRCLIKGTNTLQYMPLTGMFKIVEWCDAFDKFVCTHPKGCLHDIEDDGVRHLHTRGNPTSCAIPFYDWVKGTNQYEVSLSDPDEFSRPRIKQNPNDQKVKAKFKFERSTFRNSVIKRALGGQVAKAFKNGTSCWEKPLLVARVAATSSATQKLSAQEEDLFFKVPFVPPKCRLEDNPFAKLFMATSTTVAVDTSAEKVDFWFGFPFVSLWNRLEDNPFGKLFTDASTTVSSIKQQPQQQQQARHSESPCTSSSVGESPVGESPVGESPIGEPKVKVPLDCDELYSIELCAAEPSENLIDDELQDDRIPHRRIPEPEELLLDNRVNDYRTPGYKMFADWGVGHGHGDMKGRRAYLNESTLSHIELEPGHGAYDCPSKCILGIDPDQLHEIGLNLFTKMFIHQKIKRVPAVKDATFEFNVKFRDDPTLASAVAGPSGST